MRHSVLVAGLCVAATACLPARETFVERRMFAMGTWVDTILESDDETNDEKTFEDIESLLRAFERDYYAWSDGELSEINDAIAASRPIRPTAEMTQLLTRAMQLSALSERAFEPGIGSLVELWGFHSSTETASVPAPDFIRAWLDAHISIGDLSIENGTVVSTNPELKLDLGAIAKGEAVDRIIDLLRARGLQNAVVNAGGDLRVLGTRTDRPWRIGIQAPRDDELLGYIELSDGEAAFTSGDYERYFDSGERRMHHILDPTTGYPAAHTQAVTVLAADGVTADAAATALFVAGPDRWRDAAARLNITTALRVDASGAIEMTEAMRTRLKSARIEQTEDASPTS
jgi:thiamine biosynthesis lipoprotein